MPRKRYKPEEIVAKLRQVDVLVSSSPQVHDEYREVWTTMNDTDRPDIRERIRSLAFTARDKLKASGKDKFEHLIK